MGKSKVVPKRLLHATESLTLTPPDNLTESQTIARVVSGAGNNLYNVELPTSFQKLEGSDAKAASVLVELPAQFRNAIWLKRGSYVVVDTAAQERRENKIRGSIVNVVRDERAWRKEKYWPQEFESKRSLLPEDSESEEESNVGKMPPSDDESD